MDTPVFEGVGPALVTPFRADGSVDEAAFRAHVEHVLEAGVHFLVPCGSTGEAATLTPGEQARLIRITVEVAGGRVPVMAGAGTNSTADAVELARAAADAGADALLSVTPYYNKPTAGGLLRHYERVAEAAGIPVFLYNVPGRTGLDMSAETVLRIAERVEHVAGVKEASGSLDRFMTLLRNRPPGFVVLSGEDHLTYPLLTLGGDGVISVVANAAPRAMATLCEAALQGEFERALVEHWRLLPLMRAVFVETNPIPVKAALELMGRGEARFRLPLTPLSPQHRETLAAALETAGLDVVEPGGKAGA